MLVCLTARTFNAPRFLYCRSHTPLPAQATEHARENCARLATLLPPSLLYLHVMYCCSRPHLPAQATEQARGTMHFWRSYCPQACYTLTSCTAALVPAACLHRPRSTRGSTVHYWRRCCPPVCCTCTSQTPTTWLAMRRSPGTCNGWWLGEQGEGLRSGGWGKRAGRLRFGGWGRRGRGAKV